MSNNKTDRSLLSRGERSLYRQGNLSDANPKKRRGLVRQKEKENQIGQGSIGSERRISRRGQAARKKRRGLARSQKMKERSAVLLEARGDRHS